MAKADNPYRLADKAAELLNRRAVRRFDSTKNKLSQLKFDELNVIKETKSLYEKLADDNLEVMLDLSKEQYERVEPHGKKKPTKAWLVAFLAAYNAVTKYVYMNEVERKRERLAESINSVNAKLSEFDKGLAYWSRMTGWYLDMVLDESTLKAFEDAGVKKVMWNTQGDEKVCKTCRERDKKIYPIGNIPPKPHPGCRCWFSPVLEVET